MVHQGEQHAMPPSESELCEILHGRRSDLDFDFLFGLPRFGCTENEATSVVQGALAHCAGAERERRHHATPFAELGIPTITDNRNIPFADALKGDDVTRYRCDVCDNVPFADMFKKYNTDNHLRIHQKSHAQPPLHVACTLPYGATWVKFLCAKGAKVNEQNHEGLTPLHQALLGDARHHRQNTEECVSMLLQCGANANARDAQGDTPLLYLRSHLRRGLYEEAAALGRLLLHHGADPDAADRQGRSLLTYAVHQLDAGLALSRLLLNHGASVWCGGGAKDDIDHSAFSWFLKAVIRQRRLDACSHATLRLLSHAMAEQPRRMHAHVLRTMFRHVRCFRVLGPVFLQLKLAMAAHWSQPHDLKALCRRTLRRSMGAHRVAQATPGLGLPRPLQRYVLME